MCKTCQPRLAQVSLGTNTLNCVPIAWENNRPSAFFRIFLYLCWTDLPKCRGHFGTSWGTNIWIMGVGNAEKSSQMWNYAEIRYFPPFFQHSSQCIISAPSTAITLHFSTLPVESERYTEK